MRMPATSRRQYHHSQWVSHSHVMRRAVSCWPEGSGVVFMAAAMGNRILPPDVASTGNPLGDVIDFIRHLLVDRTAGLGLMTIHAVVRFCRLHESYRCQSMLVRLLSKPVAVIRSPLFER